MVLLFIAVLVAVGFLFDPNDYKDDITAAVARTTGRELTLDGDLTLALFPSIRIAVGSAALSNAPGFGEQPFARIGGAELTLQILPLLSGNVAVDEARLSGLELNLARDARGRNNWQDLAGSGGAAAPEAAPADDGAGSASLDLDVGAVEIADARITWTDAATGSNWELTSFDLTAEDFGPGERFPLSMSFALAGEEVQVTVDATMQATLVLADNTYRLDELEVQLAGRGPAWPGGEGEASLGFETLAANLSAETVELSGLRLEFLGVTMLGSLSGQRLFSDLTLTGAVDIPQFNPRDTLAAFDVELETADSAVLGRASAKANLLYNSTQIGLRDMQLMLDDSTLSGRVGLENEALRYSLAIDDINIDRYLPPATEGDAPAEEGSLDEVDLPLPALRDLNASGELTFGRAKFSGMTLDGRVIRAHGGERPAATAAAGGALRRPLQRRHPRERASRRGKRHAAAAARRRGSRAALRATCSQSEDVTGIGDVRLNVTAAGTNLGEMRRGLDGDVAFTVTNGSLEGFDLWYELRRARARLDGVAVPERGDDPRRTPFSSLSASGVVQDALLTNRDLSGKLDFMTVTGTGTVNLLDDMIDFDLVARFVDGPKLQSDPDMAKLAGQELPLRATGTIAEPSVLPDFSAAVRERASQAVDESVEEERAEIEERVDEQREEVQERVRDRLRGILDRDD